ncbi:MAG: Tol-Pal system beta propeller repeat protein TolB [Deltaproteobacteria bacterium]|nr:Tol-Pal system beta propeller repeat protein TolB [Deltaproteobacteria bacterium]
MPPARALSTVVLIFFTVWSVSGAEKVIIDITSPEIRRWNVALLDLDLLSPDSPHAWASAVPKVISKDLEMSGLFEVLNPQAFLAGRPEDFSKEDWLHYRDWSLIGADGLVVGSYQRNEEGEFGIELRLYDIAQARMTVGKRYTGKPEHLRAIAHRFANEILAAFTGEAGPFGSQIAYVSDQTGNKEIYRMEMDGTEIVAVTQNKAINLSPRWSSTGMRILYTTYRYGDPDLLIHDLIHGEDIKFVVEPGLQMGGEFSPDGKWVVYSLTQKGNSDIYVMDFSNKKSRRLTSDWALDVSPRWSPDGDQIIFVSDRAGSPQLYIMDVRRGEARRITFQGNYNASPVWSPRGDRIAYASLEGNRFQIYTIDTLGKDLKRLTQTDSNEESPSWSPDGRYLIFSSNREGNYDLYIMNASGSNLQRLTRTRANETAPDWSGRLWQTQE